MSKLTWRTKLLKRTKFRATNKAKQNPGWIRCKQSIGFRKVAGVAVWSELIGRIRAGSIPALNQAMGLLEPWLVKWQGWLVGLDPTRYQEANYVILLKLIGHGQGSEQLLQACYSHQPELLLQDLRIAAWEALFKFPYEVKVANRATLLFQQYFTSRLFVRFRSELTKVSRESTFDHSSFTANLDQTVEQYPVCFLSQRQFWLSYLVNLNLTLTQIETCTGITQNELKKEIEEICHRLN